MLPEINYAYQTNFNAKAKGTKRPYIPGFKVKLLDLIRPDWHYAIPNLEQRVNVLLWLCQTSVPFRKGSLYNGLSCLMPDKYRTTDNVCLGHGAYEMSGIIQKKVTELLLRINVDNDVWLWRQKTGLLDITAEVFIPIRTYRYRAAMPIKSFTSFDDLINNILDTKIKTLGYSPNSCHADATIIKSVCFAVGADTKEHRNYCFIINYTTPDHPNGGWEVCVECEPGETFVDFVIRLNAAKDSIYNDGKCLDFESGYFGHTKLK